MALEGKEPLDGIGGLSRLSTRAARMPASTGGTAVVRQDGLYRLQSLMESSKSLELGGVQSAQSSS
ncbi:hypothetical protein PC116_g29567 [Phytophthora cactorum]|nr:hypothetical protein PC116_g29567 [Phytophthora cactorum]